MKFATPFNIKPEEWTEATALKDWDPSKAQQQFRDECDINVLFGRYLETGEIPQVLDQGLAYGDFTGIFDYQTAMNAVRAAQETFNELPARIKNRFDNDPNKLLHFLNDPENRDEAEFLGLVAKRQDPQLGGPAVPPQPAGGPVATPPATPPASPAGSPSGAAPAAPQ